MYLDLHLVPAMADAAVGARGKGEIEGEGRKRGRRERAGSQGAREPGSQGAREQKFMS
jgi:hypothetical protein